MPTSPKTSLIESVRKAALLRGSDALEDGELLARFVDRRDEGALAALVERHGPMVWGVCRRLLSHHDAEDAFQATFMVLVRKAATIAPRRMVGNWLYGVAHQTARQALRAAARRLAREVHVKAMPNPVCAAPDQWSEVQPVLDEELSRLPNNYRAVIVLCDLESRSRKEVAKQLDVPEGTVAGRLARARAMLAKRLTRRGVTLSGAAVAAVLAQNIASAAMPPSIASSTVQAGLLVAAGQAPAGALAANVIALTDNVLKAMLVSKLKMIAALVVLVGVMATSAALIIDRIMASPTHEAVIPDRDARGGSKHFDDPLPPGAIARIGTTRLRHGGSVTSVAFFPDSKTIASGGVDGKIRIWDAGTGKQVREFDGDHIVFSPDGKTFASWSNCNHLHTAKDSNASIRVWDAASGKQLFSVSRGPHSRAKTVAFSQDGKWLAAGGVNSDKLNQLSLWEVATGKEVAAPIMGPKRDYVYRMAFAPDGKMIATSGDDDNTIRFWDLAGGAELAPLGQNGQAFAFSPSGVHLAVGALEGGRSRIRLFDVATRKESLPFQDAEGDVSAVAYSRNGVLLFAGTHDGTIHSWHASTGKLVRTLHGHSTTVTSLAVSMDGKTLVSGSEDSSVRVWEIATGREAHPQSGHQGMVTSLAVSHDGKQVISASGDKSIRVWDWASGTERSRLVNPHALQSIALSPNGKLLAARNAVIDGNGNYLPQVCRLWDLTSGKELRQFPELKEEPGRSVSAIAFSPDGRTLALGRWRSIHLIDPDSGQEVCKADSTVKSGGEISFIAFAPDGKTMAWSHPCHWRLSETAAGAEIGGGVFHYGENSTAHVSWGQFLPDGNTLLLMVPIDEPKSSFIVWDIANRKEMRRFGGEHYHAYSAALSPGGGTLAAGGGDGVIRLWDVGTGKELRQLRGHLGRHGGGVTALAWSSDGRTLFSGGVDTTILVWRFAPSE